MGAFQIESIDSRCLVEENKVVDNPRAKIQLKLNTIKKAADVKNQLSIIKNNLTENFHYDEFELTLEGREVVFLISLKKNNQPVTFEQFTKDFEQALLFDPYQLKPKLAEVKRVIDGEYQTQKQWKNGCTGFVITKADEDRKKYKTIGLQKLHQKQQTFCPSMQSDAEQKAERKKLATDVFFEMLKEEHERPKIKGELDKDVMKILFSGGFSNWSFRHPLTFPNRTYDFFVDWCGSEAALNQAIRDAKAKFAQHKQAPSSSSSASGPRGK